MKSSQKNPDTCLYLWACVLQNGVNVTVICKLQKLCYRGLKNMYCCFTVSFCVFQLQCPGFYIQSFTKSVNELWQLMELYFRGERLMKIMFLIGQKHNYEWMRMFLSLFWRCTLTYKPVKNIDHGFLLYINVNSLLSKMLIRDIVRKKWSDRLWSRFSVCPGSTTEQRQYGCMWFSQNV